MSDQKNLFITIGLSAAILLGFHFFYEAPRQRALQEAKARQEAAQALAAPPAAGAAPTGAPGAVASGGVADALRDRATVLGEGQRITIRTPRLAGSLNLRGGRFDDLSLQDYRETVDKSSPAVTLLSPSGAPGAFFAEYGWTANGAAVPGPTTEWQAADTADLTPEHPVTLRWDNGEGLTFERTVAVDANYMFSISQKVTNNGAAAVTLYPYARIARASHPTLVGSYMLHEGPIGLMDGTLKEISYKDVAGETSKSFDTKGGWLGITDKYWLVSLVPDQAKSLTAHVTHQEKGDLYQTDYAEPSVTLEAGQSTESGERLFAGAKEMKLLDGYQDDQHIPLFNRAIDFGHLWFLTMPFSLALDFFGRLLGNFGLGIMLFTICLRTLMFPLAQKQFRSAAKMKKLQPQVEAIRKRAGDDKQKASIEMMALYKKEGANPMTGCLPVLIQMPIFWSLYKVLSVTIEMRHAPFFGWIHDLSAPDPTSLFNLFGLLPFAPPSFLHLGVWPILLGCTMFLLQKMTPTPGMDPTQQKVMMTMPLVFTWMMGSLPAGLVIYYVWSNLFSVTQQYVLMRRMGVKPT
ncbi:membrane protein insertase YidC [Nitrospirillum sp. BR 11163]|uniref:membrane protein insertase YidC n=1 Tax=Nitrospirillum sp. BR 11163 TaxID=3104323 RepID=UPI002B00146D|nr:membrane protein insertase YidC [Nitrospirillum sp. BR 11163]MEA1677247.1 membrane protein insertase YidC [Nitrospirillum sp. BR 11163]